MSEMTVNLILWGYFSYKVEVYKPPLTFLPLAEVSMTTALRSLLELGPMLLVFIFDRDACRKANQIRYTLHILVHVLLHYVGVNLMSEFTGHSAIMEEVFLRGNSVQLFQLYLSL